MEEEEEDLKLSLSLRTTAAIGPSVLTDHRRLYLFSGRDHLYETREEKVISSDEEEGGEVGSRSRSERKKLQLSKEQSSVLEDAFKQHHTLNPRQKFALAKELNLRPRQVEVWFQNQRARTKLKKTEVDCELLKRCCVNLSEENRRLQRELSELRALKRPPPHLLMQVGGGLPPPPPTTLLTICPSCERAGAPPSIKNYKRPTPPPPRFYSPQLPLS